MKQNSSKIMLSYKNKEYLKLDEIIPKIVYKYRSFKNENHKKIITNQEIYLAKPSEFNCFYDMNYIIDKEYVQNELNRRKYYSKYLKTSDLNNSKINNLIKNIPITNDYLIEFENSIKKSYDELFGVFSTSENYKNQRLWKDFGDNRKGFCVGIDLIKAIPINEGLRGRIDYVNQDKMPQNKLLDIEGSDEFVRSYFNWIFTLPNQYIDEQEYRFVKIIVSNIERKRIIPKESICEIIIGEKMSNSDREELIKMIKEHLPHVKMKRLKYGNKGILQEILIE